MNKGFKNYIYSSSNIKLAKENCNEVLRIINEENSNTIKKVNLSIYKEMKNHKKVKKTKKMLKIRYIDDLEDYVIMFEFRYTDASKNQISNFNL